LPDVIIKDAGPKGKGLFANRHFDPGEVILYVDLTKYKKRYTLSEMEESGIDSEHWEYIGRGRYVLVDSPAAYVNHSCDPNAYIEFKVLEKRYLIAIKPIKKGEEIMCDYTLSSVNQIDNETWVLRCKCGSRNCRDLVTGDFFKLPREVQREKLPYLPTWVKRKYRLRIKELFGDK